MIHFETRLTTRLNTGPIMDEFDRGGSLRKTQPKPYEDTNEIIDYLRTKGEKVLQRKEKPLL